MKKLTELDLQTAMDECAEIKFRSHGEWLAGMVKRLNARLSTQQDIKSFVVKSSKKKEPFVMPPGKVIMTTGNTVEPDVPCKS